MSWYKRLISNEPDYLWLFMFSNVFCCMKFNFMKNELLTYTMSPKEKNFRPKQTELNHRRNIFTCILSNSVALVSMFSYKQHRDSINKE